MTSGEGTLVMSNSSSLQYSFNALVTIQTHYYCKFNNKEANKISIIRNIIFARAMIKLHSPTFKFT